MRGYWYLAVTYRALSKAVAVLLRGLTGLHAWLSWQYVTAQRRSQR